MEDILSRAIDYVRKNITCTIPYEDIIYDQASHQLNGTDISPSTLDEIERLMCEFYECEELPTEQWKEETDPEEIFLDYLDFRFYDQDGDKIYNV